jgi:hypothetical protein
LRARPDIGWRGTRLALGRRMGTRRLIVVLVSLAALALLAGACKGSFVGDGGGGGNGGGGGGDDDDGSGGGGGGGDDPPAGAVTWYKDVLPVVQAKCAGCHADGAAAFALDTYEAAKPLASVMKMSVIAKRMPPWPPDALCGDFEGQEHRTLSAAEQDLFVRWADDGAWAGDPADAPAPPAPPPGLGTPDIALDPGGTYTFDNAAEDLYWCFRLPGNYTGQDIVAMDIEPGNTAIVHHVIVFREPGGAQQAKGLPGFQCDGVPPRTDFFFGWVPGAQPARFPSGMGMRIEPGDALVMQVHYHKAPAGTDTSDRTTLKLYTAKTPVAERLRVVWTGSIDISVPAGGTSTASGTCTVPQGAAPVKVVSVAPHMHQVATSFKSTVTRAGGGGTQCLVDIPRWDFEWQGGYQYKQPVVLNPGDRIETRCSYQNAGAQAVGFGEGTGDEMCFQFLFVVDDGSLPEKCFSPCNVIDCEALGF